MPHCDVEANLLALRQRVTAHHVDTDIDIARIARQKRHGNRVCALIQKRVRWIPVLAASKAALKLESTCFVCGDQTNATAFAAFDVVDSPLRKTIQPLDIGAHPGEFESQAAWPFW